MDDTINIEVDEETAREFLSNIMDEIQTALEQKAELEERIATLDARAKKIRAQMPNGGGKARQPHGANAKLISDYLASLSGNKGATGAAIAVATGVKTPSVYYTLQNSPDKFVNDPETGVWKLKYTIEDF